MHRLLSFNSFVFSILYFQIELEKRKEIKGSETDKFWNPKRERERKNNKANDYMSHL